ncbi:MAG: SCO6745 family protein [Acidimicrobiales bacterium]
MDHRLARTIWHYLEMVNAVTYFAPECRQAARELGLKGFWMGYFGCRAAPLGPVGAAVVEATFFNFEPSRVRRAIPDAWSFAEPTDVVEARSTAAAAALRRLLTHEGAADLARRTLPVLDSSIASGDPGGRPLFAANRDVRRPDDPVAALWQAATALREHRGDSHVCLLAAAGLAGCEVHVLFAACAGITPSVFQDSRGWSPADWRKAVQRLRNRKLLDDADLATAEGLRLHQSIERHTDELAGAPFRRVGDRLVEGLIDDLRPAARRIAATGQIPFPNPMGLPRPITTS